MRRPNLLVRAKTYLTRFNSYVTLMDSNRTSVRRYWMELDRHSPLLRDLESTLGSAMVRPGADLGAIVRGRTGLERIATQFGGSAANRELHTLVRLGCPDRVVETGVASGISTAIILDALDQNGHGHLWSIDLPNYDSTGYVNADGRLESVRIPLGAEPGWVIPARLRPRWTLKVGSSADLLSTLLNELGPIDMFFHDSEHSYSTMTFEYQSVWPALRQGGLLYSDDVTWNEAFDHFAIANGYSPTLTPAGRGVLRKKGIPDYSTQPIRRNT